jgi:hypothetical protein
MAVSSIGAGVIVFLAILALAFDFINGFYDAATSIATIVSTRVLRAHWAVVRASFFNFVAFLFFGLSVANTIGTGVIDSAVVDIYVILGVLAGAIVCNVSRSEPFELIPGIALQRLPMSSLAESRLPRYIAGTFPRGCPRGVS